MIRIDRPHLLQWLGTEDPVTALAPQYWHLEATGMPCAGAAPRPGVAPLTLGVDAEPGGGLVAEFFAGDGADWPLCSIFRLHASPVRDAPGMPGAKLVIDGLWLGGAPVRLTETERVKLALLRFNEAATAMQAGEAPGWPEDGDSDGGGLGPPPCDGTTGGLGLPPPGGSRGARADTRRRRNMPAGRPPGPG